MTVFVCLSNDGLCDDQVSWARILMLRQSRNYLYTSELGPNFNVFRNYLFKRAEPEFLFFQTRNNLLYTKYNNI